MFNQSDRNEADASGIIASDVSSSLSLSKAGQGRVLSDTFSRVFKYLRLSITDRCSFKCEYCLPNGYQGSRESIDHELSIDEIRHLVTAFAALGVEKVRLTGGEPMIRRDLTRIASEISRISGISKVALSTNGYKLRSMAKGLLDGGITQLNISVDSLNRERFYEITKVDALNEILTGIDECLGLSFKSIKVNAVLRKSTETEELDSVLDYIKFRPISFRFIELMEMSNSKKYFDKNHISSGTLRLNLLRRGFKQLPRTLSDAGPAVEFASPDFMGSIGIIAPYSQDFCNTCNRLRVSSDGHLRLCLFGENDFNLRPFIQSAESQHSLETELCEVLNLKNKSHRLHNRRSGMMTSLSSIGG